MKNRKTNLFGGLAMLVLLCALTACTSKSNAPDADGSTDAGKDKVTQIMPGTTEQQPQYIAVQPEQLGKMGEPIGAMDVQNQEAVPDALLYCINKATIYESFEEAGIAPEAMITGEDNLLDENGQLMLDENGELKPSVKFMLLELTVQNVGAGQERASSELRILCADADAAFGENKEASFFDLNPSTPAYFSNPTGKRIGDNWQEYYSYSLPVGQNKTLKVGWYVDTDQYDLQNLYLTFCYDEYQRYVKLDF